MQTEDLPSKLSVSQILQISLDTMRKDANADRVFRSIGIPSSPEEINIHYVFFAIKRLIKSEIKDIIPLVLTELNMIFDNITAKTLEKIAKKGSDITWDCELHFINNMVSKLSGLPDEMVKVIIIPKNLKIALNSMSKFPETRDWYEEFSQHMLCSKTQIIISDYIGDNVYIIQKPLLAEYRGSFPEIYNKGYNKRSYKYWLNFSMSNFDFKPQIPEAIVRYELKNIVVENI